MIWHVVINVVVLPSCRYPISFRFSGCPVLIWQILVSGVSCSGRCNDAIIRWRHFVIIRGGCWRRYRGNRDLRSDAITILVRCGDVGAVDDADGDGGRVDGGLVRWRQIVDSGAITGICGWRAWHRKRRHAGVAETNPS